MAQDDFADIGDLFDSIVPEEPEVTATPEATIPEGGADIGSLADSFFQADDAFEGLIAQGDNPSRDKPEAGFFSGVAGGAVGLVNSAVGVPAMLINNKMNEFAQENFPETGFAAWTKQNAEEQSLRVQGRTEYLRSLPTTRTLQNLAESESVGEFFDTFAGSEEKWATFKEFAGQILPSSAAFAGGALAQGLKGAFATDMIIEWGDGYQESLREGKTEDEALLAATVKALVQSGIDTTTLGIGKIKLAANKYQDMLAQTGIQMVGGGGAEFLKHEVVGEETTTGAVLLEAIGEGFGTPIDLLAIRAHENRGKKMREAFAKLKVDLETQAEEMGLNGAKKSILDAINQLEGQEAIEAEAEAEIPLPTTPAKGPHIDPMTGATLSDATSLELLLNADIQTIEGIQKLEAVDWETTPVVTATETHWTGQLQNSELRLESAQRTLQQFQGFIDNQATLQEELPAGTMEAWEAEVQTATKDVAQATSAIERIQERVQQETLFTEKAAELVQSWVSQFAPEMRVIVSSGQIGNLIAEINIAKVQVANTAGNYKTERAYQADLTKAKNFNIKETTSGAAGTFLEFTNGIAVLELDVGRLDKSEGFIKQADFVETVAHEFGHALISHIFKTADVKTKKALTTGYKRWLKKLVGTKNSKEFFQVHGGAARATRIGSEERLMNSPDVYWYSMNEYLANQLSKSVGHLKLVGTPVEGFFKKALTALRELFNVNKESMPEQTFTDFLNLLALKQTLTEVEAAQQFADVQTQEQIQVRAEAIVAEVLKTSNIGGRKKKGGTPYGVEEFRGDLDKYNSVLKWGVTLLQLGKLNQHIPGLQKYIGLIKEWWNTKMQQTARADERLQQWNDLKAKDSENLGNFMQELTVRSYDEGVRYLAEDEVYKKLAEKYNMSPEMLALADLIEQDFASVLDELEAVQVADAQKNLLDDIAKEAAINEISKTFKELRDKNFFPLSRFGEWFMRIKAQKDMAYEGVEYKAGDTITFETFESQKDMTKRQKIFGNKDKYLVEGGLMNDTQKQFAGFPPQFLGMLKDKLALTEVQKAHFADLIHDLAPGKSFTKHMKHRKNTPGFSTDAVRSYANYFLHFGNYVARIKYKGLLQDAINDVGESAKIIGKRTGDGSKRTRIQQYMADHYEAAMNPGNELANLRAVGFLWYLGFVPKSAVVNLTQVPLVTYPFLAARYGDVEAMGALGKATKDAAKYWLNPRAMRKGQMDMIFELIQTGILDESMATELAAASEGSLLNRITPGTLLGSEKAARGVRRMAGAGAWMFQKAEKMNRRVTALAAYELAQKAGANQAQAVAAARDAVETTQYEYARWNRPRFSQGKKSVMFLFWQYMQNSLFFLATDPGRMRYVAIMLLFAGMSGLPFAEDAMDLWDYIAKKLNKRFGEDFSPANIRHSAREFITELGANPDLMMHGASRYSFGMSALGDMVGLPIPNVDMSGSLSMGGIIPGWHAMLGDTTFDKGLGRGAEDLGGAVVAMPIQLMRAIADDNPDTLKRFERAMPSFAKHMSKAYRYATRGEETLPDGTVITHFNKDDSKHRAEIGMQFLGFNVTRVADAKEPHYMTKEILQYYALRRSSLTQMLDYALRSGDSKMYANTWREVRKYNKSVMAKGLGSMGIRTKNVRRSLKDREKQRKMQELGIVGGKMGAQISQEVYDAFSIDEEVP